MSSLLIGTVVLPPVAPGPLEMVETAMFEQRWGLGDILGLQEF